MNSDTSDTTTFFSVLYSVKNGKQYQWSITINIVENNTVSMITTHGYSNGKQTESVKVIREGKAGRTIKEQAILEAKSKWTDKREKEQYQESPIQFLTSQAVFRPMLAQTFDITPKKPHVFPVYTQRKYDGIRCIARFVDGQVILESRNGVAISHFDTIKRELLKVFTTSCTNNNGIYLDGELYTHELPFETISGIVRCKTLSTNDIVKMNQIRYCIYDCYYSNNSAMPYTERRDSLQQLLSVLQEDTNSYIIGVITEEANSILDIQKLHHQYCEEGFEGIMIRFPKGAYESNKRSKYLQKYKTFIDSEYRIIGFHEGDASETGCVIWECITETGGTFSVRPSGTREQRKEWYGNGTQYIGKMLTVVYQELSQDGIPRFPVGKCIRDYE